MCTYNTRRGFKMDKEVSELADKIYEFLKQEKVARLSRIPAEVDAPASRVYMALGWLMREDKLLIAKRGRRVEVTLKEKPFLMADVVKEKLGRAADDITRLAEKTGKDARDLALRIKDSLKSAARNIGSRDVREEIKTVIDRVDRLVDKTGEEAKELAEEIRARIRRIREKSG
jgi:hypothetical protein